MRNSRQDANSLKNVSAKIPADLNDWLEEEKNKTDGKETKTDLLVAGIMMLKEHRERQQRINEKWDAMTREGLADADADNLISTEEMLSYLDSIEDEGHEAN